MNNLDLLSEVLQDFCTKYNLPEQSADDILYGYDQTSFPHNTNLSEYQRDWLRNYINVWDIIVNQ